MALEAGRSPVPSPKSHSLCSLTSGGSLRLLSGQKAKAAHALAPGPTQRFYYSQKTFLFLRLSGIRPAPFLFFLYLKRVDFTGLHCRLLRITLKAPPSNCRVESRLQHSLLQLDFKRNLQPGVGFEKRVRSPSLSVIRIEWQGLGIIFKMTSLMLRVT